MARARTIAAWIAQVLLGGIFVLAGVGKFAQWDGWIQRFGTWGYAAWFMVAIALLEVIGGILIFVPRFAAYGAALIGAIMIGAAYTHASTGIGTPTQVIPHLVFCVIVLVLRWRDRWDPSEKSTA